MKLSHFNLVAFIIFMAGFVFTLRLPPSEVEKIRHSVYEVFTFGDDQIAALSRDKAMVNGIDFSPKSLTSVYSHRALAEKFAELSAENALLRQSLLRMDEVQAKNDELRDDLDFRRNLPLRDRLVAARVTERNAATWWKTVQIDIGTRDGIEFGNAVIDPAGTLVGKVVQVSNGRSEVLLLWDEACLVRAEVAGLPEKGAVFGPRLSDPLGDPKLTLGSISRNGNRDALIGKKVFSMGEFREGEGDASGGVFPSNLLIGEIVDYKVLDKSGEATVVPAADFSTLSELFVFRDPLKWKNKASNFQKVEPVDGAEPEGASQEPPQAVAVIEGAGMSEEKGEKVSVAMPDAVAEEKTEASSPRKAIPVSDGIDSLEKKYSAIELARRYLKLFRETSELRLYRQQMDLMEEENQRLEKSSEFKRGYSLKDRLLATQVIGRETSNWWGEVLINRGAKDGVALEDPVLTSEGFVVGKVHDVGDHASKVLLISDEKCKVSVEIRQVYPVPQGIMMGWPANQGQPDTLKIHFLEKGIEKRGLEGNPVRTEGLLDSPEELRLFPPALDIGEILRAETEATYGVAYVKPHADLGDLSDLFVVRMER